jgi:hypothetical protein
MLDNGTRVFLKKSNSEAVSSSCKSPFANVLVLARVQKHQAELDLRDLVPEGMETSPQAGLLSNVAFLLHCSEGVWNETVLPALRSRLAS